MANVTWTVELDADPDTTGQFVIGQSLLGGSDLIAPDERWIDATSNGNKWRSLSIRRGSSDNGLRSYDAGECIVEFDNRTGDFDPDNPYGFFVMGPQRLLAPGTGVRAIANVTIDATVFTGVIEEPVVRDHDRIPTAVYSSTDLMARLGNLDVPLQGGETGTGESSSVRANWLLDQAGIPASKRSVQAAGRACLGTTGEGKVRTGLERVAAGEAGRLFVDRAGLVTLTWHDAEYNKTSEVDFTDTTGGTRYSRFETSPGVSGVINTAVVHRTPARARNEETGQFEDGVEIPDVGAADGDSVAVFGPKLVTVECVLLEDADAASLATFLATRRSQPTTRPTLIVPVPLKRMSNAQAQAILELDLGSMVTVVRHTVDGRELMFTATVEGVAIDVTPGLTTVALTTTASDTAAIFGGTGWFIIGSSLLGGADVLAPY